MQGLGGDEDWVQKMHAKYAHLKDGYREILAAGKALPYSMKVSKQKELSALWKKLKSWYDRLYALLKPYAPASDSIWSKLAAVLSGKSIKTTRDAQYLYNVLSLYENELDLYGKEFHSITKVKLRHTEKSKELKSERSMLDKLIDLMWEPVKIGGVALLIWYGGRYLYNYLEKQSRYPAHKLPRYAGGRRKSSGRRRRRRR
jgi:esterase/lipase